MNEWTWYSVDHRRCSVKKVFLKCSLNWQKSTCARVSFYVMLRPSAKVFSSGYCEIFKNIFSIKHLRMSASVFLQNAFFNKFRYIPMINTYLFLLLKCLNAIAKFRHGVNKLENRKNKDMWFNLVFRNTRSYKNKVAGWEFFNHRS